MQMKSNCVNIHGYCSNFGYLKNFGLTNVEDFWAKCVKFVAFYILQCFTSTNADSLKFEKSRYPGKIYIVTNNIEN